MGRKKTGLRTSSVKIESDLAKKARAISADQGISMAEYLSVVIRAAVDKDWPKVLRKLAEDAEK